MSHARRFLTGSLLVLFVLFVLTIPADAAWLGSHPTPTLQAAPETRIVQSPPVTRAVQAKPAARTSGPARTVRKQTARDIQGFRLGMSMRSVKQLLAKKGISSYETGFNDLFIYSPVFGTEVKLQFSCGEQERVLSTIQVAARFPASEADRAIAVYSDKLIAKYGRPASSESGSASIDMRWGAYGRQGRSALEARTNLVENGDVQLVVALSDQSLLQACKGRRTAKINRWLYQWIHDIPKIQIGMPLKEVSLLYQKRYHDRLVAEEEQEEASEQDPILRYTVRDYEFFSGLDYESVNFEGEGPGTILMKFTGDQSGPKSGLNKRLYYALFTTTAFSKAHAFADLQKKLDAFITSYGKPSEVQQTDNEVVAQWQTGSGQVKVSILNSGLITVELSAPGIKDAYLEAALRQLEEFRKNRFDTSLF